jgi:hypothetical protein
MVFMLLVMGVMGAKGVTLTLAVLPVMVAVAVTEVQVALFRL